MTQAPKQSLTIDMPGVDFAGMAREAIASKLTESLIGADEAITGIVVAAMAQRVDSNGQSERYADRNNCSFIEWVARDLIRAAAKQAIADRVERLRPALEAQIEKQLSKNTKSIAVSLTDAFIKQAAAGYGVVFNITAEMRVKD